MENESDTNALGENGAGKTTLMRAIYGVAKPDAGEIIWEGQSVAIASPNHARQLGIAMVFQHFSLFETLTVAENVALAMSGNPDLTDLSRQRAQALGLAWKVKLPLAGAGQRAAPSSPAILP